jgi:hypothetical protein
MTNLKLLHRTDELADKVRRYAAVELREVRANPNKASVPEAVIQSEGTKVLQAIRPQVP